MVQLPHRVARVATFVSLSCLFALPAQERTWSKAQQRGCDYLSAMQKDGKFMGRRGPDVGFTALAITALQSKPRAQRSEDEQAVIDKGLRWVLTQQNEDGSFGRDNLNYTTCATVMALARWMHVDEAKAALAKAQKYVLGIQKCEANGTSMKDVEYGGVGYGSRGERSDLSNVQFAISALRASGLDAEHEALVRARTFLQRTQNLRSVNDLDGELQVDAGNDERGKLAVGDDGGAVYYPGESPAGFVVNPDKGVTPRSYGSMTYALLKCYTLCGVKKDDPRVQAAVRWISRHWTVTENPGADPAAPEKTRYQGLFYNYMLMSQALTTVGLDRIAPADASGAKKGEAVDWRAMLRAQLEKTQADDGSWVNDKNDRWFEGFGMLCTCYALLALENC